MTIYGSSLSIYCKIQKRIQPFFARAIVIMLTYPREEILVDWEDYMKCGGAYFWLYGIVCWMLIQQKLTSPELLSKTLTQCRKNVFKTSFVDLVVLVLLVLYTGISYNTLLSVLFLDLGHSRTGAIPLHIPCLLQRCPGCHGNVWHHKQLEFRERENMDEGGPWPHLPGYSSDNGRK